MNQSNSHCVISRAPEGERALRTWAASQGESQAYDYQLCFVGLQKDFPDKWPHYVQQNHKKQERSPPWTMCSKTTWFHNVYATHSREGTQTSCSLEHIWLHSSFQWNTHWQNLYSKTFFFIVQRNSNVQQNKDNTSLLFLGLGGETTNPIML